MLLLKVVVLCVALTSCLAAPSLSKRGRLMDLSTYWETLQKLRDHSNGKTNGNGNDEQTRSTEKPIFTEEQIREILHILDIKLTKRNLDFLKNPDVIEKMKEYLRNNGGLMISRSIDEDLYGAPLTHSQIMDLIEEHIGKRSSSSWFEEFYGKPLTTQQVYDQIIKPQLGKRSDLYGSPLTHAQIMDLVRQHGETVF
ncbi:uncharacterized protein LOC101849559 [Aplysia californica]|uniref:Uncharacterized protein LOC101849559 n=1 Tax=Aplysia californica TaxID=6500 RepID=A0ABM1VYS5_APLCA|nr:uncharacterized protein LOC101849559 [Aplysia californica]